MYEAMAGMGGGIAGGRMSSLRQTDTFASKEAKTGYFKLQEIIFRFERKWFDAIKKNPKAWNQFRYRDASGNIKGNDIVSPISGAVFDMNKADQGYDSAKRFMTPDQIKQAIQIGVIVVVGAAVAVVTGGL